MISEWENLVKEQIVKILAMWFLSYKENTADMIYLKVRNELNYDIVKIVIQVILLPSIGETKKLSWQFLTDCFLGKITEYHTKYFDEHAGS